MHCPSCDVLVQDKFKEVKNIKEVYPDYRSRTAEVIYKDHLDRRILNDKINQFGYQVVDTPVKEFIEPLSKRLTDVGAITILLFIVYFFAQELHLLPSFNTTTGSGLTYLTVFVLGLVASASTCMATSGALFLSTVGKLNKKEASITENIIPAVSFNVGRVLSYGIFGFIAGLIGKAAAQSLNLGSFLTFIVSVGMILIGLNMLKLISFSFITGSSITKGLFGKLESKLISHPKQAAFFLGSITYLLPCGFTQSVQLYALGLANPVQSALMMMTFALGTIPALLAIGFASSFTQSRHYPMFVKVMGVLIVLIGLSYFRNVLTLYGVNVNVFSAGSKSSTSTVANLRNGFQEIHMTVNARGYTPNDFTVKQGQKVRMIVNGENVFGCQGTMRIPKYDIVKTLASGENVIEFTPEEKGTVPFSCIMGMFRGQIEVI